MNNHNKILLFYGVDFLLLNLSLLLVNYLKRDTFVFSPLYLKLLIIFNLSLAATFVLAKKRPTSLTPYFLTNLLVLLKANALLIYLVSMMAYMLGLSSFSRVQTFGTSLLFLVLEIIFISAFASFAIKTQSLKETVAIKAKNGMIRNSYSLMLLDVLLVGIAFFLVHFIKNHTFILADNYEHIILAFYTFFIPISFVTHKYDKENFNHFMDAVTPALKTIVAMIACFSFLVFALQLFYFSRIMVFGTIALVFVLETILFFLYCRYREFLPNKDIEDIESVRKIMLQEQYPLEEISVKPTEVTDPVHEKLKHTLDFLTPRLYEFISHHIDLQLIDREHTAILNTDKLFAVDVLLPQRYQLILNLHKLNDMRWFNRYFLKLHTRLRKNGIYIGKAHTITTHYDYFLAKNNKVIAHLLYAIDFVWSRIFPKLPLTRNLYFSITRGRNRIVSRAEIFGRLSFCGFKIVAETVIDHRLYFIAQKVKTPSTNTNPTYGPLIKLNRTGYNGKIIQVYKFRTMHPYSEFLQEYIYEHCNLDEGGKFNNDFRITSWGHVFRKYWIDELPMLYNWLKGEMKIFGVRPLSKQYFNLYNDELKSLRHKVKPGLVPPFYADLPKTLNEIIDSELNYIKQYLKAPIRTQLVYFWKSCMNILWRGARSK